MEKTAARDKWVCLACRWTAKIPLVDVRSADRPSYRCPKCREKMLCAGTAFRPPRQGDDEGWAVAEKLLAMGFRYVSTRRRRRVPRTMKELEVWTRAAASPEGWLSERRVRIHREKGRAVVHCGPQEIGDGQKVLVWSDGEWVEGRVRLLGDGRKMLPNPRVILSGTRRSVALEPDLRLRLRSERV